MDIIQSYYTLSNKNNGAELMFLFNIGLSLLIGKRILARDKDTNVATRINIISLPTSCSNIISLSTSCSNIPDHIISQNPRSSY